MLVGITYDLRAEYLREGYSEDETAEFDRPDTIDAIENTLRELGYQTDRIGHVRQLTARLAAGARWDLVFNICEGLKGFAREAQVPALLDAFQIPYTFSDPLVLALTLHKGLTKRVIRDLGLPTPDFAVVEDEKEIDKIELPFPLFAKPVAEGTGKGVTEASKIRTRAELKSVCAELLAKYSQPVLVETFLPGREFTVAIAGTGKDTRSLGVAEVILKPGAEDDVYSYVNKENCEELVEYRWVTDELSAQAAQVAVASWRGLSCRDAGRVDLRTDAAGMPNFIEVNPLAGLHPAHSDLPIICTQAGISYRSLIEMILESAKKRLPGK